MQGGSDSGSIAGDYPVSRISFFRSIVLLFLYMDASGMPTSALSSNGRKQGRISGKRKSAKTESVTLLSWMNLHDKAGEF